jgi:hypothetical protein
MPEVRTKKCQENPVFSGWIAEFILGTGNPPLDGKLVCENPSEYEFRDG